MSHGYRTSVLLLIFSTASILQAGLLTNGSFEENAITSAPWYARSLTSLPGWTQYGDGVDVVHDNYTQAPTVLANPQDGLQFIDMNQAGTNGGIRQVVAATAGQRYRLTLYAANWAQNGLDARVTYSLYDPGTSNIISTASFGPATVGGVWNLLTLEGVAASSQIGVQIYGSYATQAGMGIDNVDLQLAAPEPATLAVAGVALAGLALRRRRGCRSAF